MLLVRLFSTFTHLNVSTVCDIIDGECTNRKKQQLKNSKFIVLAC